VGVEDAFGVFISAMILSGIEPLATAA